MNNKNFLEKLIEGFKSYLSTGANSNEKLKIIHSAISEDIKNRLGNKYQVFSLGLDSGKEKRIQGRYIDKWVDITIAIDEKPIAGIGFKFVMSNYQQNSNNYFETMLGETVNLRVNKIPYFQMLIVFEKTPRYKDGGKLKNFEILNNENFKKYTILSKDNIEVFFHTPTKMLIYILKLPEADKTVVSREKYAEYYKNKNFKVSNAFDNLQFDSGVILNDFEKFIEKAVSYIKSI
ncbi:MAG: hypothetical protein LBV16_06920 [Elusimicrobiota bacterium]|jgi:hypothetical protein|nr:hypothetical protein [Elusimicrobiota bacterium]